MKWIKLSEEQPTEKESWAIVYADGAMNFRMWNVNDERFEDVEGAAMPNVNNSDITHWMPAPERPTMTLREVVLAGDEELINGCFDKLEDAIARNDRRTLEDILRNPKSTDPFLKN